MSKPIEVGDRVTWTDRLGRRYSGKVTDVSNPEDVDGFTRPALVVIIDNEDDMSTVLDAAEVELESAVDRLGKLVDGKPG